MTLRVLIVDDSVVVRQTLASVLERDRDIEVLRPAPNGRIGLSRIASEKPDVVILDVEMPVLNGIETLTEIRKTDRQLPVIMFSTLTERGAATTMDALARGASDYMSKPTSVKQMSETLEDLRTEMVEKIRGLCGAGSPVAGPAASVRPVEPRVRPRAGAAGTPKLVVVGVSTGGPNALAEFIPSLPADLPVPVLIVQHMPAMFTPLLAERLDKVSALSVRQAQGGEVARPGEVWIAPGDFHMTVSAAPEGLVLELNQEAKVQSCRPAADVLFRSAVEAVGGRALAVVLTGMGQDGLDGCRALSEAGGRVIVQDEPSSVVWGMPGYVSKAGLAELELPLSDVAPACERICKRSTATASES